MQQTANWKAISTDPNAPTVLAARRQLLTAKRLPELIDDRCAYIAQLAKGKKVLDVGVVEHFPDASRHEVWLHDHIRNAAASCLGIDILEDGVRSLQERGYRVICGDVTARPLQETFDLVVIGDVIEHVGNPGALMLHAGAMLGPGGRLVITTPNPWYLNPIIKHLFEGRPFTDSADHVMWFDPSTIMELGQRAGLMLDRYAGIKMQHSGSFVSRLATRLTPILIALGAGRLLFAKSILYEFVHD